MTPDRLGALIGATFGLIYVEVNAGALPAAAALTARILGALAYAAVLVLLVRARGSAAPDDGGPRRGFTRGYWLIVAAEVAAFLGGNLLLNGPLDRPSAVLGWITFVVGVHFFGLAVVWRARSLAWIGGGLAALGLAGLAAAFAGAAHAVVASLAGVAPGALLLGGGLWALSAARRTATAA
ncbi:hypothetical protein [Actinomadura macrotermitis]|uniref:Uncharacterized protein n=1 Tax=Actinomadura macrotermitis TaxID=2585200 RepID=A0A7K0BUB3_9ACTN|nr:hypothetical protein [Actinomadura macrotermitis]MQY04790.1 hypothetical protein [Actinomadura macrotermitis]